MVLTKTLDGPGLRLASNGTTTTVDTEEDEDLPPSPEDIQVNAADVQEFDQTFLAQSQNFQIDGQHSPAPFPLQVLPRVAFTINYNMVWNPDRQRWEADEGNDGGGAVQWSFRLVDRDTDTSNVQANAGEFIILRNSTGFDIQVEPPASPTLNDTFALASDIDGSGDAFIQDPAGREINGGVSIIIGGQEGVRCWYDDSTDEWWSTHVP